MQIFSKNFAFVFLPNDYKNTSIFSTIQSWRLKTNKVLKHDVIYKIITTGDLILGKIS